MRGRYDPDVLYRDYELPPVVRWCVVNPDNGIISPVTYSTRNAARYSCGTLPYRVRKVLMFVKLEGRRTR